MLKIKFNDSAKMYPCEIEQAGNVVTLKGITVKNTSGFISYGSNGRVLRNRSDYSTIYRVLDNAIQYSNDGSVYEEPTRDIAIQINWVNDEEDMRPDQVDVLVNKNGSMENIILTEENGWEHVYEEIPISTPDYTISTGEVIGYDKTINGTTITFEIPDATPSMQEQIDDLLDVVCDLDERVFALEEQ